MAPRARMLQAGVDRFALAQRVAALEPQQAEWMEQQYAAQWAKAWPLLEDVRRCEEHLLQRGFVEDMVDQLAALLPDGLGLLAPRREALPSAPRRWRACSRRAPPWEVRQLAGLALLHRGEVSRSSPALAHSCLTDERERIRVEAALAVSRWRVFEWIRIGVKGWEQVRELSRQAMAHPELAARAAVAWARASRGRSSPRWMCSSPSGRGSRTRIADVRFECALCLEDEAGLMDGARLDGLGAGRRGPPGADRVGLARGSSSGWRARETRSSCATWSGTLPGPRFRARRWRRCSPLSERGPERLTAPLLPLVEGRPFAELVPEDQARWSQWARSGCPKRPERTALRSLHWAAQPPVKPEAVRVFVEATAEALAREPADVRAQAAWRTSYFSRFLALAGPEEEPLLNQWAREAECGAPLARDAHDIDLAHSGTGRSLRGRPRAC